MYKNICLYHLIYVKRSEVWHVMCIQSITSPDCFPPPYFHISQISPLSPFPSLPLNPIHYALRWISIDTVWQVSLLPLQFFLQLTLKWSFKIINRIILLPCLELAWLPIAQMKLQISHKASRSRLSQACLPHLPTIPTMPSGCSALWASPTGQALSHLRVFPYAVSASWHSSLWIFPFIFQGLHKCLQEEFPDLKTRLGLFFVHELRVFIC